VPSILATKKGRKLTLFLERGGGEGSSSGITFADAQEGELAEWDDGAAGREVSVEIRVADH
jgi:hypothetical protein